MSTHQVNRGSLPLTRWFRHCVGATTLTLALLLLAAPATADIDAEAEFQAIAAETLAVAVHNAGDVRWSVYVSDDTGRIRLAFAQDAALIPASTMKTLTAATALEMLSADGRRTTRLERDGRISDGTLVGDLLLVGDWDPTLATSDFAQWIYPERPATLLDDLADAVVAAGISQIDGAVVAVERPTVRARTARGWPDRYFEDFDARRMTALSINGGLWTALQREGEPALPVQPGMQDAVVPPAPGAENPPVRVAIRQAVDPALHAVITLTAMLEDRGVTVHDRPRRDRTGEQHGEVVGAVASPPIGELVAFFMRTSDNHIADAMFRASGLAHTDEDGWEAGRQAAEHTLDVLTIPREDAVIEDGSGLSRENRLSARMLADIDRTMWQGQHGALWSMVHATAGATGTLQRRFVGTIAEESFRGKTGSLRDVMALHGTITGTQERVYLAFITNEVASADRAVVRAAIDRLVELYAADAHGCDVTREIDGVVAAAPAAGARTFPQFSVLCD